MRARDRQIIEALEKFKVLKRDHIAQMFYSHCKKPETNVNHALLRLKNRGYIECVSKTFEQNIYFPSPTKIKKNSQKINHYLMIADIYLQMKKYYDVKLFEIEPYIQEFKLIPDIQAIWGGSIWWVEAQNSSYTAKQMHDKLSKYEELYLSGKYKEFHFQHKDKKFFPHVLIIGQTKYNVDNYSFRIFQAESIDDFMKVLGRVVE